MKLLLDSDVIINILKQNYILPKEYYQYELIISRITYIEVMYGILRNRSKRNFLSFNNLIDDFSLKIEEIDAYISYHYLINKLELENNGQKLPDNDIFIATTAIVTGAKLLTFNLKHFKRIRDLQIIELVK